MMLGALNVYNNQDKPLLSVGVTIKNKKGLRRLVRFLEKRFEGSTETYVEKKRRKK